MKSNLNKFIIIILMNFDAHSSELYEKMMECKYSLNSIVAYKIITT